MKLQTFAEQRNRKLGVVSNKEAWAIPNAYEEFAIKLGKHDWAVTLTLKQTYLVTTDRGTYSKRLTYEDCENIGFRFLARLNRLAYKHKYKRNNKQVKAIWKIENGGWKRRFHLHFAIGRLPKWHNNIQFIEQAITDIKEHVEELDKVIDIRHIYSKRYNGYLTKELLAHRYDGFYIEH
jgi:hypothetical protein